MPKLSKIIIVALGLVGFVVLGLAFSPPKPSSDARFLMQTMDVAHKAMCRRGIFGDDTERRC